jgi:ribosome-associated heat shock protein Hsp15
MRLDRWLWCTRFFKTRVLAGHAVKAGHVRVAGQRVKPAKEIDCGAFVSITKGVETWHLIVRALPQRRGPAAEAQTCYEESAGSAAERAQRRGQRRAAVMGAPTVGRPDKRTRRLIRARLREEV